MRHIKATKELLRSIFSDHRISEKPGKTLLWLWVARDMRRIKGKEIGVDAACGAMINRKYFQTAQYIGIDINEKGLAEGKSKYPEAITIQTKLQDIDNIQGDLILCVQAIGTNRHFENEDSLLVIKRLVDILNPGGTLIGTNIQQTDSYHLCLLL